MSIEQQLVHRVASAFLPRVFHGWHSVAELEQEVWALLMSLEPFRAWWMANEKQLQADLYQNNIVQLPDSLLTVVRPTVNRHLNTQRKRLQRQAQRVRQFRKDEPIPARESSCCAWLNTFAQVCAELRSEPFAWECAQAVLGIHPTFRSFRELASSRAWGSESACYRRWKQLRTQVAAKIDFLSSC